MSDFRASRTTGATARVAEREPVKVMIVDDALVIRGMLTRILEAEGDISVISSVGDGERALAALKRRPVDVVVLDIEMPVMDGMTALPKITEAYPDVKVIMASTLTQRNAEISLEALQKGAADYIAKPSSSGEIRAADMFKRELVEKVRALGRARGPVPNARMRTADGRKLTPVTSGMPRQDSSIKLRPAILYRPDIIAIGSSTGGPQALVKVLGAIGTVAQPIVITQHMPPTFTRILAQHITRAGKMPCFEGEDDLALEAGTTYIAPGNRHMLVKSQGGRKVIKLSDGPQENYCRPSVDPMLRSVVAVYGRKALAVILTGMGSDGAKGCEDVVAAGGQVIAQDEATSVVWGMPGAVAKRELCSAILPLNEVAGCIAKYAHFGVGGRA